MKNKNRGFTIMETLVAIFILLLAITGPMVFAQNGLRASFLARDQVTAFFLAQDAIEYIKNIRDGNVVDIIKSTSANSTGWLNGLEECISANGCTIDTSSPNAFPDNDDIESCLSESNLGCVGEELEDYTPLKYDTDTGIYTIKESGTSGSDTIDSIFAREIKIEKVYESGATEYEENREAEITVTIRWKSHEGVGVREIVVRENIFNWANALIDNNN